MNSVYFEGVRRVGKRQCAEEQFLGAKHCESISWVLVVFAVCWDNSSLFEYLFSMKKCEPGQRYCFPA